jgi:hypothetical protein
MCLLNAKYIGEVKEDIACYKVVYVYEYMGKEYLGTPYHRAAVKIGRAYHSQIGYCRLRDIVQEALHSFAKLKDARHECKLWNAIGGEYRIAKCIIPKGAEYYEGIFMPGRGDKCYASSAIKYVKLLKI